MFEDESESANDNRQKLSRLIARRGQLKAYLTRFKKFISDVTNNDKISEISTRLQKIEAIFGEFSGVQSEIEFLDSDKKQTDEGALFEDEFYSNISLAKDIIEAYHQNQTVAAMQTMTPNAQPPMPKSNFNVQLPPLVLPEFSGQYEKWSNFCDSFTAIIHNNPNLSNIQKYYYLQASLKGEAAYIVESLEISDANYSVAWGLLQDRYQNKKCIIKNHVKLLFDLPSVKQDSFSSLRVFLDNFQKNFRALKNMKEPVEAWSTILIHLLLTKLDTNTRKEWEISTKDIISPDIDKFIAFLTERCNVLESIDNKSTSQISNQTTFNKKSVYIHNKTHSNIAVTKSPCIFCQGEHSIYFCKDFQKLSVPLRLQAMRRLRACTNCLRLGHTNSDCNSGTCRTCKNKHNTLLHLGRQDQKNGQSSNAPDQTKPIISEQNNTTNASPNDQNSSQNCSNPNNDKSNSSIVFCSQNVYDVTSAHCSTNTFVILSTALIQILDRNNEPIICRALLDGGSQSNFMSNNLFDKLKIPKNKVKIQVIGINDQPSNILSMTKTKIKSLDSSHQYELDFLVTNKITGNIPQISFDTSRFYIPSNIKLADPKFNQSGNVDILLGAGIFYNVLSNGQIRLGKNAPVLQNTKLGWIVAGPFQTGPMPNNTFCNFSKTLKLENQMEKFWLLEEPLIKENNYSIEESEVEEHFKNTFERDYSGSFIVRLPFKENYVQLGESYTMALKRFQSLEHKLSKSTLQKEQYTKFIEEYLQMGHMTLLTKPEISKSYCFLPHHSVLKESSQTTKLRVVFDASAKTSTNLSLNDVLKVGPCIQEPIFSILLRFRVHSVVFTADIAKMYRCIKLHENDKQFQQILWRSNPSEPLKQYQLNTLTYGTSPASFLATRCLKQLSLDYSKSHPLASQSISQDFFMDDWICSIKDIESALEIIHDVNTILKSANFNLRQWSSNRNEILDFVKGSQSDNQYVIKDGQSSKTLGTLWNSSDDVFKYTTSSNPHKILTKRLVLSIISQVFDPLGLIGPVILKAKLFMQSLWQIKTGWDEPVPQDFLNSFLHFYSKLDCLDILEIPRQIIINSAVVIEIHIFCDASLSGYGTCVYFKSIDSCNQVIIRLACSKSRVSPLKVISIPRLELCGALLGAQLAQDVLKSIKIEVHNVYFWSDSTIALGWIASEPSKLKTFVSNRVAKIQELSNSSQWRHVDTNSNPADYISRGVSPDEIKNLSLWFNGPDWLYKSEQFWPVLNSNLPEELPEMKIVNETVLKVEIHLPNYIISKYSSFSKLTHIVAYLLRFRFNLTKNSKERLLSKLSVNEIEMAIHTIVKMVQEESFSNEIKLLKNSRLLSKNNKLRSLDPFLDQNGILRVGGRLVNANLKFDSKHPILVPSHHHFTNILIRHEHFKKLHLGPQTLLAIVRQTYWILGGVRTIKRILRTCILCFRVSPPALNQKMGDLPTSRVTPSRPFSRCGVDYAGPYLIKNSYLRNTKSVKAWICLFICFSTKAVHLELVTELSTDSFLKALKRFISRRGLCSEIHSDNATNFVGAENIFKQLNDSNVQNFLLEQKIKWHFIPPRSPHVGGLWEAAIRLAKYHLKRTLQNQLLSYEDFNTLLVQVESLINSRPLTPLTDDPTNYEAITPGHFLIGQSLQSLPEVPVDDCRHTYASKYRHLKFMFQQLWRKWSRDYLNTLQQRCKWQVGCENVQIGELVVLREDDVPPLCWKLGRISAVHPGNDGLVRVVTVKTKDSEYKRAVTKICVLPKQVELPNQVEGTSNCFD